MPRGPHPTAGPRGAEDSIDRVRDHWAVVRPDLDMAPMAVVARLARVRAHIDAELESVYAPHGLTGPAFLALVTLRRLDQPGGVSQRQLADELALTAGTVSVRVDRLVAAGLATRRPDPDDRRGARVALTAAGHRLFDAVAPEHLAREVELLAALDGGQQAQLADLLRTLLLSFEGSAPPEGVPARLGLRLAPAHVAIAMRRAVGLPDAWGLLVREVDPTGAGAAAGLRVGDVIVKADGRELRAAATLYAALAEALPSGRLRLEVVRASSTRRVTVRLDATAGPDRVADVGERRPRGVRRRSMFSPGRVEAFSDGVFAVAITLLVLDLTEPRGAGTLAHRLLEQWPSYAAYVVSFAVIGIIWINHHDTFSHLVAVDRPLQLLNLLLLMTVVVIPFPTSLLAEHLLDADAQTAALAYGITMTTMGIAFTALWWYLARQPDLLRADEGTGDRAAYALHRFRRSAVGPLVYAVATVVGLVSAPASLALFGAVAVFFAFAHEPAPG